MEKRVFRKVGKVQAPEGFMDLPALSVAVGRPLTLKGPQKPRLVQGTSRLAKGEPEQDTPPRQHSRLVAGRRSNAMRVLRPYLSTWKWPRQAPANASVHRSEGGERECRWHCSQFRLATVTKNYIKKIKTAVGISVGLNLSMHFSYLAFAKSQT